MNNSFLFCGYYGYQNTGDDAFCKVASLGSRKYWDAKKVLFLSNSLPALSEKDLYVNRKGKLFSYLQKLKYLTIADRVVFFGGSIFHYIPRILSMKRLIFSYSKLRTKKKFAAVGISLGPFKTKESYDCIRSFLQRLDFIATRDTRSYDIAKSMNLSTPLIDGRDPALILPDFVDKKMLKKEKNNNNKVVGVSLCSYEKYFGCDIEKEKKRERILKEVCLRLLNQGVTLRLFVFNGNNKTGDIGLIKEFINEVGVRKNCGIVYYNKDPVSTLSEISRCDFVLAVRMHAAIFSYMMSVPFLLVEYHQKCTDFLNDIGFSKSFRITDMLPSAKELSEIIKEILAKDIRLWNQDLDKLKELSKLSFTEGRRYLV